MEITTKKKYEKPVITKHYSGMMNKFGAKQTLAAKKEIEGVPVNAIMEKFGSPVFVFSEKQIRNNQRNANRIFKTRYPRVQFAWSYKTNYLDAVCSVFHQEGSWAEVVSEFEYDKAKRLGVKGTQIIYNGPYKSDASLIKAMKDKAKIHIDHFDELYRLIELSRENNLKGHVAIRVNMDTGVFPKWDRFGFNYENGEAWQAIKRIVTSETLQLTGLHTHIGTYIMSADAYRVAASKLSALCKAVKDDFDIQLEYIDLGGGFASNNTLQGQYLPAEELVPSMEQYADAISGGLYELPFRGEELPLLILETGRALIDNTGYLLSTVVANKRLSNGTRALIIDAGVNILMTAVWYKHKISPAQETGIHTEETVIYGPLCMNIDCIRDSVVFPSLKLNDKVVIEYAGAYDVTQWMQFISYRPNVVMIMEDGSLELIRRSEDLETITANELTPAKLKSF